MLLQVFWLCCVLISSSWANPYPIDPTMAKLFEGREKKKEKEEAISESEEAEDKKTVAECLSWTGRTIPSDMKMSPTAEHQGRHLQKRGAFSSRRRLVSEWS